jgi:lipopolysaccharide/colanic/teichoic acid biosynthesis glycosyltransferase
MKRLLDVVLVVVGMTVAAPLMGVISLVLKLSSPTEPVLFRQVRVGRRGSPFTILKFRSMTSAANDGAPLVTAGSDPRITTIGRALRSTKLDELPQLLNVLRGDMSLVGPRPEVPQYAAYWSDSERSTILSVRPGITDPASVMFRREEQVLATKADPEAYYVEVILPAKATVYVNYVLSRSLIGDLRIISGTLRSVVSG